MTMEPLLTYETAAEFLDCSASKVQKMCNNGEIPIVKIGNRTRIDPADLRLWIKNRKHFQAKECSNDNGKQPLPTTEATFARS